MLAPCGVVAWGALLIGLTAALTPEHVFTSGFLFFDHGVNLLVADVILRGGRLYRDVAYPYGALPAYIYAGLAGLMGNGVRTYLGYVSFFSLVHLGLIYWSIRRFRSAPFAAACCVLAFIPTMLTPARSVGSYTTAGYITVERCFLALLAIAYVAPRR